MKITAMTALLALLPAPALAGEATDLLGRLQGEWTSAGPAFGGPAKSMMRWSPTLDGRFVRIDYLIAMERQGSTQTFTGIGHYKPGDGAEATGYWADNSGDLHPLNARADKDALTTIWGTAGGEQGRTEYRFMPDGKVRVTDWVLTAEGWRQFNQNLFERKGGA